MGHRIFHSISQIKDLPQDPHRILWPTDCMPSGSWVFIDFVIVTTLEGLVAEEVNGFVVDAGKSLGWICFCLYMLQAVRLVPAVWEDVERDLTADRVPKCLVSHSQAHKARRR